MRLISYNQTNYILLGKVIDKLSGQPFTQFIKEHQLDSARCEILFMLMTAMLCRIVPGPIRTFVTAKTGRWSTRRA
jgi:hypothetical protein